MNIISIFRKFKNQKACVEFLEKARWNSKPKCTYCESDHVCKNNEEFRHYCYSCKKSFSVTVGTIFHHTHLPLQKWFLAISLILNAKKGISSLQLSRDLEVNKNTAWRMGMQIRKAMIQKGVKELLKGIIEMDETFIGRNLRGNKIKNGPKGGTLKRGRGTKKAPVIGAIERGKEGKIVAKAVGNDEMKAVNMNAFIEENVDLKNAHLMTDEYWGYFNMHKIISHSIIKHKKNYVYDNIHTNTIESFWAVLKRGIFGQFHNVSRKYLQKYIDEFCYRYNMRGSTPQDSFDEIINLALTI